MKRLHIFFLFIPFLTPIFGTKVAKRAPINDKPAPNKKNSPVKPMAKNPITKPNDMVDEEELSWKKIIFLILVIWVIINAVFLIGNYFQVSPYEQQIKILEKQGVVNGSMDSQPIKDIKGNEYKNIKTVGDLKDYLPPNHPFENKFLRYTLSLSSIILNLSGKKYWSTIESK